MRSRARPTAGKSPRAAGGGDSAPPAVGTHVLEQVVRASADGIVAFDRDGRVALWNPALERLLGVPAATALGRPVRELLPPAPPGEPDDAVAVTLAGGRTAPHERRLAATRRSGPGALVEIAFAPLHDAAGAPAGGLATVRDVTARREAEAARAAAERAADRSHRLQALTAALSEAATVEQVADVIVFKGMEAIGADAGSLALVSATEAGAQRFEIVRTSGFATEVVSRFRFHPVTPGRPLSDAVRDRVPVLLDSAAAWDQHYADVAFETPYPAFEGFAGIPIVCRGRVLAGVSFSFRAAQQFDDGVRTFLATLGEQCAQALERAGLFEAERRARAAAEAASRAKGEFLATMSHELRTPLNAIAGYCDLLLLGLHGPLTDAQRDDLGRVQRSQGQLLALVDDVLSFASREDDAIAVADVALAPLLDAVADAAAPRLAAKQLELVRAPAADPALRVRADAARVRQILLNLLSNAAKFTEAGGRVTVGATPRGAAVAIEVRDTGRGIPPESHETIFAPFTQLDRGYTRTTDGTGLGLAIARDLARAMGGDVLVESAVGAGSVFTVVLPAA